MTGGEKAGETMREVKTTRERDMDIETEAEAIALFRSALGDAWTALSKSSLYDQSDTSTVRHRLGHKLDTQLQEVSKLLGDWTALYDEAASLASQAE